MTRDEMIETLEGAISNAESFERDVSLDIREAQTLLAALRAPAVTGEAELPPRPPIPEPDAVPGLPRYGVTWQGGKNEPLLTPMPDGYWTPMPDGYWTPMPDGYWTPWHLAATPPAAGAPPALVALVQEWQASEHALRFNNPEDEREAKWARHAKATRALLAWSPAPAPVADEHVVGYTRGGTPLMKVVNVNAAGNFDVGVYAMPQLKREPAPPAMAGGDAPECPECDGDGYTEIGPVGDDYAVYQIQCKACRGTGRRRQEGQ